MSYEPIISYLVYIQVFIGANEKNMKNISFLVAIFKKKKSMSVTRQRKSLNGK